MTPQKIFQITDISLLDFIEPKFFSYKILIIEIIEKESKYTKAKRFTTFKDSGQVRKMFG